MMIPLLVTAGVAMLQDVTKMRDKNKVGELDKTPHTRNPLAPDLTVW